jgi:hypothetical protein
LRHAVFKVGHSPWIAAKVAFSEVPPVLFPVEAPWCLSLRFFEIVFLILLTHIFKTSLGTILFNPKAFQVFLLPFYSSVSI